MESLECMALRPSANARPRPSTQGGDLEGGGGELRLDCGPSGDPSGEGGCPRWVFAVHARRAVGIPRLWAEHTAGEGHTGTSGRQRRFWALGVVSVAGGLAAEGSVPLENPRAVQQKVSRRFSTFGEPACSAAEGESRWRPSFTGGVGAPWIPDWNGFPQHSWSHIVPFRRAAGEEVKSVSVYGKYRLCGNRSPESALAILQKSPPDVVWTHDQSHAITSI
jgi:hypothetical protein